MGLSWNDLLDRNDVFIIDTETTGLGRDAEVIEIAVLDTKGAERFHALSMPVGRISPSATRIHGLTRQNLRRDGARAWPQVWRELKPILTKSTNVLGWNVEFDIRMIRQTLIRHRLRLPRLHYRDLVKDYRDIRNEYPARGRHTLEAVCRRERITVRKKAHSAVGDCQRVLAIMKKVTDT